MRKTNANFGAIQVKLGAEHKQRLIVMANNQQRDLSKMVRWLIDKEWSAGGYQIVDQKSDTSVASFGE